MKVEFMNRNQAENALYRIFGHREFYDEQWQTIERLFRGERLLMIERTGYGKSLCYQFPATQFKYTTVVFSPLIALMRDQIDYLQSKDIAAECINSEQTPEENTRIIAEAKQGKIKILYIAPERQENQEWIEAVQSGQIKISMAVIDEAHCVSMWGHDFRPAFRRIISLIKMLPRNFPVLATTATATDRVAQDIIKQMEGHVRLVRGDLMRKNFRLSVVTFDSEDAKFAWVAEFLQKQSADATGIIYTGTRVNTELYSRWLGANGFSVASYNAGLDPESRKAIEEGLLLNKYNCIVSTNALGMGIDKSNIRFIVHTQLPASLIHYYQEIGRAGRDGLPAQIALLYNQKDRELPRSFIEKNRPDIKLYTRAVDALRREPLGEYDLMRRTNLTQTQIRVIRSDLIDQGIINEAAYGGKKKYELKHNAPALDTEPFKRLRGFKEQELQKMIDYAEAEKGGMNILCEYLGDNPGAATDGCERYTYALSESWRKAIAAFRDDYFPELPVETKNSILINGVAASYYGVSNVGSVIHRCKYENGGDYPGHLIKQTLRAYRARLSQTAFDLVLYVPPAVSGDLVKNFSVAVAKSLGLHLSHGLVKLRETKQQKIFQNGVLKRDNVKDAFDYAGPEDIEGKSILLIDDIFDSGATIKEIGRMLKKKGTAKAAPLAIARTVGGDLS